MVTRLPPNRVRVRRIGEATPRGVPMVSRPAQLADAARRDLEAAPHFCGVTGLKPTYGRVSRANAMPLSFSLDTVGPLARTAEDCALILAAVAGPDPLDPTTDRAPAWDVAKTAPAPGGLTIGIPSEFYVDDLDSDVAKPWTARWRSCASSACASSPSS
jgi:Amidase